MYNRAMNISHLELDEQCAALMGWQRNERDVAGSLVVTWRPPASAPFSTLEIFGLCPRFSSDPAAARLLEDEIERRGLIHAYTNTLVSLLEYQAEAGPLGWFVLRATPEQRAEAFLKVTKP